MSRDVTGVLVEFARTLRHAGVDASPQRVASMLEAVGALDVTDVADTYWAGRTTLCASVDDIALYDAAFSSYFGGVAPVRGLPIPVAPVMPRPAMPFGATTSAADGDSAEAINVSVSAADTEVLRSRDVATLSAVERADVRQMISMLAVGTAPRASRRRIAAVRGEVDPARTVRTMLRRGGEATHLERRRRRTTPRRLVLLVDVSGSMSPYADALLCLGFAAVHRAPSRTEVFTIGTRLTRVTRALRHRDPDAALRAAGAAIPDWHGGTRLAESIKAFLDRWGQRGMARGAVVVLCSDGWERGDAADLSEQVARLSRLAYRLVWVNPHRGKPGYEPLAAGMAACLEHLDAFVSGHSLDALEELVGVIAHA
ncbi:MAG TPA: VWA domain-containing protein [Micromonosporaceae bacterium]